ncbi:MAG: hypothetical protein NVSMB29_19850 [Candidatus Dormibacteria bacterium]
MAWFGIEPVAQGIGGSLMTRTSVGSEPLPAGAPGHTERASQDPARPPPGRPKPAVDLDLPAGTSPVPCIYCQGAIPSEAFAYRSANRRLVSASCPQCSRVITVATATWHRWSAEAESATP